LPGHGPEAYAGDQRVFRRLQAQSLNELGRAAADFLTRAIIRAVLEADGLGALTAFRDLPDW